MAVYTVRKDRHRSVDGLLLRGPTHRVHTSNQAWCGAKIIGFSSWNMHGEMDDVDCVKCQRAIAQNQPRSWKR